VRLGKDAKVELIRNVPLFSRLSKKALQEVAAIADEIDFPEGKMLAQEGARGREFVVILEGAVEVQKDGRRINMLGKDDFFGEIALVTQQPRTATVTTTKPTRALVITDRDFLALLKRSAEVGQGIVEALAERLAPELA
jgi:CRP/FNR family transcriptional regulator, cyclic AMP receptor protein